MNWRKNERWGKVESILYHEERERQRSADANPTVKTFFQILEKFQNERFRTEENQPDRRWCNSFREISAWRRTRWWSRRRSTTELKETFGCNSFVDVQQRFTLVTIHRAEKINFTGRSEKRHGRKKRNHDAQRGWNDLEDGKDDDRTNGSRNKPPFHRPLKGKVRWKQKFVKDKTNLREIPWRNFSSIWKSQRLHQWPLMKAKVEREGRSPPLLTSVSPSIFSISIRTRQNDNEQKRTKSVRQVVLLSQKKISRNFFYLSRRTSKSRNSTIKMKNDVADLRIRRRSKR